MKDVDLVIHTIIAECCDLLAMTTNLSHDEIEGCRNLMLTVKEEQLKVQKIREEVEKRYEYWKEKEFNSHSIESEIRMSECQHLLLIIDSLQEEPINEDLEDAARKWLHPKLDKSYANYGEPKMMELTHFDGYNMLDAIEFGSEWQKETLWKDAQGDDIPEIDREVIALLNSGKVVFAHRPYKGKYIGKSLTTGNIETFENKTYDKGGWSIPDVKYWLDCDFPKEKEE